MSSQHGQPSGETPATPSPSEPSPASLAPATRRALEVSWFLGSCRASRDAGRPWCPWYHPKVPFSLFPEAVMSVTPDSLGHISHDSRRPGGRMEKSRVPCWTVTFWEVALSRPFLESVFCLCCVCTVPTGGPRPQPVTAVPRAPCTPTASFRHLLSPLHKRVPHPCAVSSPSQSAASTVSPPFIVTFPRT